MRGVWSGEGMPAPPQNLRKNAFKGEQKRGKDWEIGKLERTLGTIRKNKKPSHV